MKNFIKISFAALLVMATLIPIAQADGFNQNHIIDDSVFDNATTLSAAQIDSFLNNFTGSCISSANGFSAPDPTGYNPTSGFIYGTNVSAGQIIYDSSQAYSLNPEVLLTTLQKEQGLVTGNDGCSTLRYAAAAGYGCPDGGTTYNYSGVDLYSINGAEVTSVNGTCVNTSLKVGFSQQVIRAAWLLKFGEQRSEGNISWAVIRGSWNNSDDPQSCYGGPMTQGTWARCPSGGSAYYDGYTTIDNQAVHMDNGATAAMYWYTPHFAGNQNFYNLFFGWFGNTIGPDYYGYGTQKTLYTDANRTASLATSHGMYYLAPGEKVYVTVKEYNDGRTTWQNSNTRLGTTSPIDRSSPFADSSWYSNNRIAAMQESAVSPGQTATFNFTITAPQQVGNYAENYAVVVETVAWIGGTSVTLPIAVAQPASSGSLNDSQAILSSNQSLAKGSALYSPEGNSILKFQNNGNLELYTNFTKVWQSNTAGSTASALTLRPDGNLVLSSTDGSTVWSTGTSTSGANALTLQTDGNLVLYANGTAVWSSGTSGVDQTAVVNQIMIANGTMFPGQYMTSIDRKYTLALQADGNLVLYSTKRAIWASGTYGKHSGSLVMQADGNLVLYDINGYPIWASGTYGNDGSLLIAQQDGNTVIYSPSHAAWATNTANQQ